MVMLYHMAILQLVIHLVCSLLCCSNSETNWAIVSLYLCIGLADGGELFPLNGLFYPMDVDTGVPQFEATGVGKEDTEYIPYKLHMNES